MGLEPPAALTCLSLSDWQRGDELCLLFPFGESQGCSSFAFPLPSVSDHTVGAFGFKAPEWDAAFSVSFLPPASDLAAGKVVSPCSMFVWR